MKLGRKVKEVSLEAPASNKRVVAAALGGLPNQSATLDSYFAGKMIKTLIN